jgi:hypothetical protein
LIRRAFACVIGLGAVPFTPAISYSQTGSPNEAKPFLVFDGTHSPDGQGTAGDFPEGSETVTIVFDAGHKVSIQLGISAGVLETN